MLGHGCTELCVETFELLRHSPEVIERCSVAFDLRDPFERGLRIPGGGRDGINKLIDPRSVVGCRPREGEDLDLVCLLLARGIALAIGIAVVGDAPGCTTRGSWLLCAAATARTVMVRWAAVTITAT